MLNHKNWLGYCALRGGSRSSSLLIPIIYVFYVHSNHGAFNKKKKSKHTCFNPTHTYTYKLYRMILETFLYMKCAGAWCVVCPFVCLRGKISTKQLFAYIWKTVYYFAFCGLLRLAHTCYSMQI